MKSIKRTVSLIFGVATLILAEDIVPDIVDPAATGDTVDVADAEGLIGTGGAAVIVNPDDTVGDAVGVDLDKTGDVVATDNLENSGDAVTTDDAEISTGSVDTDDPDSAEQPSLHISGSQEHMMKVSGPVLHKQKTKTPQPLIDYSEHGANWAPVCTEYSEE